MKKYLLAVLATCMASYLFAQTGTLTSYSNYDFVPGDKILFEDHFTDDADGEFATHWDLVKGQAVLNKMDDALVFKLTEGNYATVAPLMKTKNYLPADFTLEFDTYMENIPQVGNAYPINFWFKDAKGKEVLDLKSDEGQTFAKYHVNGEERNLVGKMPPELLGSLYFNKWHHIAMIKKGGSIKIYVDQFRTLTIPNTTDAPAQVFFGGIGDIKKPVIFSNVRIAAGGGMNLVGKKFTDAKIVTHGINFDVNKSVIRPESMGTLNSIVQILKDNPTLKFEVDGHTDSDGDAAANMKLSQQRAEAVRTQLVNMGVDASRLTAKGFGATKPIADNKTPEGKANNRRVEFVKK